MKDIKGNIFNIVCKECGYEGTTTTSKIFPSGLGNYKVGKYVCPECFSRNIEYKPPENMEWMSGMVRNKELKEMQEKAVAKGM